MVVPTFLFTDWRDESVTQNNPNAGIPTAIKYYETGKDAKALGNTLTAVQSNHNTNYLPWAGSKTVRFQGNYYTALGFSTTAKIFQKDDPDTDTGDWSVVYTPVAIQNTGAPIGATYYAETFSAFVNVVVEGVPTLIVIYKKTSDVSDIGIVHFTGAVEVAATAPRTLEFATNGGGGADTITASSGSFIDDGYRVNAWVRVAGTSSNNGPKKIVSVTATVLTVEETLVNEGPLSSTALLSSWVEPTTLFMLPFNPSVDLAATDEVYVYEGLVYFRMGQGSSRNSHISAYDPVNLTVADGAFPAVASQSPVGKLFVLDSQFYYLAITASTTMGIRQFDGSSSWDIVKTLSATPIGTEFALSKAAAFVKDGKAYVIYLGQLSNSRGFQMYEIPVSGSSLGTETRITTTVLPANLRSSSDGGSFPGGSERWGVIALHDPEEDKVYLYVGNQQGSPVPWVLYEFSDSSTPLASVGTGSGGLTMEAGPDQFHDGYAFMHAPGDLEAWVYSDEAATGGGITISFKAAGDSGSADKVVRFKVSINGEPSDTDAILFGGATGGSASRNGNTVENVDADGSTIYTVKWNPSLNGVTAGDYWSLTPKITV